MITPEAALKSDELVNRAYLLTEEATELMLDAEVGAEDLEKAERMMTQAESMIEQSKRIKDMHEQMSLLRAVENEDTDSAGGAAGAADAEVVEFLNMGDFLSAIKETDKGLYDERLFYEEGSSRIRAEKDLSSTIGSAGGFLSPTQFVADMRALPAEASIIAPRATVIPMATRSIQMPALEQGQTTAGITHYFGGIQVFYEAEAATMTSTDVVFRLITLEAYDLQGLIHVPNQLLADSAISIQAWLNGPLGLPGAFAHRADFSYFRGSGAGQPLGILNSGARIAVARETGSTITFQDIVNMVGNSLPTPGRIFVAHIGILPTLMQISGPSGNPSFLWGDMVNGQPDRIMGIPLLFTEKVPSLGSEGDLMLIDPGFYLIGERENILFDTTDQVRWERNMTSFKAIMRHDGQPWLEKPFTLLDGSTTVSPFNVIAA